MRIIIIFALLNINLKGNSAINFNIDTDFIRFIKNKKLNKIALIPFRKNGNIEKKEIKYIQDSFLKKLTEIAKVEISEPINFEDYNNSDIILTGDIYKTADTFEIFIKMIEPKNKNIIKVFKTSFPKINFEDDLWKIDFEELKKFNDEFLEEIEFRYSVSESCKDKIKILSELQRKNLDLKARYITWKFKNNPELIKEIKRNPGSEFLDNDDKKNFYSTLKRYWDRKIYLSNEEIRKIQHFIDDEEQILNECGWR